MNKPTQLCYNIDNFIVMSLAENYVHDVYGPLLCTSVSITHSVIRYDALCDVLTHKGITCPSREMLSYVTGPLMVTVGVKRFGQAFVHMFLKLPHVL